MTRKAPRSPASRKSASVSFNAYNFMDGINGITGGYSLVILAALA